MHHEDRERLVCAVCRRPAHFFSHTGLLCADDALADAIRHEWMPARIDTGVAGRPQSAETRTVDGQLWVRS